MKKSVTISLLVILLLTAGGWPIMVNGASNTTSQPAISADSPIYFLKRGCEGLRYLIAGKEKKAELNFVYAQKRLLEAREMLEKEKLDRAEELFKKAVDEFSTGVKLLAKGTISSPQLEETKQKTKDLLIEIKNSLSATTLRNLGEGLQEGLNSLFN